MRENSPTPQTNLPPLNSTNNHNGTPPNDEEFLNLIQDPYKRTVQQKICQAELWAEIFHRKSKNDDNTTNAASKNGGSNKGNGLGGHLKKPKGGKEQQTTATK